MMIVADAVHGVFVSGQPLSRRVTVPAGGSAVVEFPVELVGTGNATWIWKARFADPTADSFTDAVQSVLEVGHVVPMLREILLSHSTGSQTNLLARANPQLLAPLQMRLELYRSKRPFVDAGKPTP